MMERTYYKESESYDLISLILGVLGLLMAHMVEAHTYIELGHRRGNVVMK